MITGQSIKDALKREGKTARWFALQSGISEGHMSRILASDDPPANVVKLAQDLLGNLPESEIFSSEIRKVTRDIPTHSDLTIPLYWQSAPAGNLTPFVSENYDEFNVTKRYKDTFAVYIRGDSLIGVGIEDDDIAVFRAQDHAHDGQVVFACISDVCTVKVWRMTERGTFLVPANPNYEPIAVDGKNVQIRGVLLNVIREPKRFLDPF